MNSFDQLVWREWRRNRTIITIALATLVVMVFLTVLSITLGTPERTIGAAAAAAMLVAVIGSVVLPIIAAVMLGAGRDEGSAESVVPLPVSRFVGLAAKLVFFSAISVATSALVLWIVYSREFSRPTGIAGLPIPLEVPTTIGLVGILATSIAWKCRVWIASFPIAAALAMVLPPATLSFVVPAAWLFGTTGRRTGYDGTLSSTGDVASWLWFLTASYAFAIGTVLLPFVAANVLAGERADRSAEFIAPLPVSRGLRLAAKVTFLSAVSVAAWFPWLSIFLVREDSAPIEVLGLPTLLQTLGVIIAFTLVAMAIAWAVASWTESPVIAGILGISLPFIVPNVAFRVPAIAVNLPPSMRRWEGMYLFWAAGGGMPPAHMVLLAAVLFAAGSTVYLRRLA